MRLAKMFSSSSTVRYFIVLFVAGVTIKKLKLPIGNNNINTVELIYNNTCCIDNSDIIT